MMFLRGERLGFWGIRNRKGNTELKAKKAVHHMNSRKTDTGPGIRWGGAFGVLS